jgi:hypothetical protein
MNKTIKWADKEYEFSHFGIPKKNDAFLTKDGEVCIKQFNAGHHGIRAILKELPLKSPFGLKSYTDQDRPGVDDLQVYTTVCCKDNELVFKCAANAPVKDRALRASYLKPSEIARLRDDLSLHLKAINYKESASEDALHSPANDGTQNATAPGGFE